MIKIRSQQFWPVGSYVCLCKFICLPDKQSPQPVHFVPEPSLLKRESQTRIMWLLWTGLLAVLKLILIVEPYCLLCINTNVLIHSNLYSQSIPVSWNKKAASLSQGLQQFIHFSSARFGGARLLMRAWLRFILWPHPRWSICYAAIILICHLLTEKKLFSIAWGRMPGNLGLVGYQYEAVAAASKRVM